MRIELHHGDCLEVLKNIPNESVDVTITSPPYYNAKDYSQYSSVDDYKNNMRAIFAEVFRITRESRMCIVNISPVIIPRLKRSMQSYRIPLHSYFVNILEDCGFEFLEDIIWEKPEGAAKNRNGTFFKGRKPLTYKPNIVTENILVVKKPSAKLLDKHIKNHSLVMGDYERTNIWRISPVSDKSHPAPYPIKLPENCIKYYSYEGDTVLDPFMGSGTTGLAAQNLNRNFIGIEKAEKYFQIAKERIEKCD